MKQGSLFYRWLFYALASLLFLALQRLLLDRLALWGVHPFVLPVLVAVAASWEDRQESLCAAAVFGLLCDLWVPSVIPCFYLLSFAAAALLSGVIARRWIMPGFFCAVAVSVSALAVNSLLTMLFLAFRGRVDTPAALWLSARELLLSAPLSIPVYFLFLPIHRRFAAE